MKQLLILLISACTLAACTPTPDGEVQLMQGAPPIYPDYADVTIPANIAPLNFLVRDDADAVELIATCGDHELRVNSRGNEVCFDEDEWHNLMQAAAGKDVSVRLSVRRSTDYQDSAASSADTPSQHANAPGTWQQWQFRWHVATDRIDPYLTYRLIEPDYEIWNHLQLQQRCIENFDEENLCDYTKADNQCMNCHIYGSQNPDLSMFYVRGPNGGAILNRKGKLSKLNIKTDDMASGSVYFGFSPNGRYIVFSTNVIIPAFHSMPRKRLEVYDSVSDVYVADLENQTIIETPLLADSAAFETFPTFSPDGKYIYYCSAPRVKLPEDIRQLQYSLCRIAFDEQTGSIGTEAETIYPAGETQGASVCHPRISPDGRRLLFTVQDYGTFPIWHRESNLRMLDLQTGEVDTLAVVNSEKSDTYHSWSSNSRWFVFASKRDDGLYGKPYFCYVDRSGKAHKPFVLPQKEPTKYDNTLKSFNAPELGRGALPFTSDDVARILKTDGKPFKKQPSLN